MGATSNSVVQALFDRGGLKEMFDHARNAVVATIIVAAGLETADHVQPSLLVGMLNPLALGYVVAGVGCALIVLNFMDGLRKLTALRWRFAWQIALCIAYLFVSFRIVQVIVWSKTHAC
ncbi:hypothetical protein [Dyella japonica]|uniref:Uncharacterized protein n=1 Tax=Dyella japonica TaxID=231455 RepID=A0ABV2K191_9GAMM